MTEYELDAIDREILYALQEEARNLSSSEIAERTDASSSTVRKRIQRLESEGVIKGYSANIDYTKSGYPIRMLLFCSAPIPDRGEYIDDVLEIPGVVSVQELVTGEQNLLVTAVGETDRDITPVAQEISDMGLTITDEVLVRSQRSTSFDEFSSQ
ncbi:Lrp/AsnC family transcriptional regulator [Halopiger djelfimassiliensis]|uniref:Lrp/AsnC family transcriptional regulator n=1 Tax=Halopiger djelfimassiliensis TaxID=1293047 RepID=UPI000677BF4B|nr:Lrp/AsnC family transcriptional regulator [Halopiger djelfimassiliensis]